MLALKDLLDKSVSQGMWGQQDHLETKGILEQKVKQDFLGQLVLLGHLVPVEPVEMLAHLVILVSKVCSATHIKKLDVSHVSLPVI